MKKILIIEDNTDLAENIGLMLKEHRFEVYLAGNGKEGLNKIMEYGPDLILCDIMLPDISGYKLLTELKKLEETEPPIFIYMTAKTMRQDLRKGMNLGADDYITKPFTQEELLSAVNTQIQKRKKLLRFTSVSEKERAEPINKEENPEHDAVVLKYNEHIFISDKKSPGFYPIRNLMVIKSLKDYSQLLFTEGKKFILRKPMIFWEKKLPGEKFARIHRQTLINIDYIDKVEIISSNRYSLEIKELNEKLEVSQRFSSKIKKLIR
jgi:DNA-binding response OmpR family regulator